MAVDQEATADKVADGGADAEDGGAPDGAAAENTETEIESLRFKPTAGVAQESESQELAEAPQTRTITIRENIQSTNPPRMASIKVATTTDILPETVEEDLQVTDGAGPRMAASGQFVIDESAIVGTVGDYNAIAADPVTTELPPMPPPDPPVKGQRQPRFRRILAGLPQWTSDVEKFKTSRQDRQLGNWNSAASSWKQEERKLVNKLGSGENLRATCHSAHRTRTKAQEMLDRAGEAVKYNTDPHGAKVGAPSLWPGADKAKREYRDSRTRDDEYWLQPELMRKSGLPMAIQHQRAVFEYIHRPTAVRKEMHNVADHSEAKSHNETLVGNLPLHATGKLDESLNRVEAWIPDCANLAVVGMNADGIVEASKQKAKGPRQRPQRQLTEWDRDGDFEGVIEEEEDDDSVAMPSARAQMPGPRICCRVAKNNKNTITTSCRVVFDTFIGAECTSSFEVLNTGTTTLHFSWQRIKVIDTLGTRLDTIERFSFDRRPGVLLPGEKRTIHARFLSPAAGIYTEPWELLTSPKLDTTPQITFSGACHREDTHANDRATIESDLERHIIGNAIKAMLYDVVRKVQPRERPMSPAANWVTDADRFVQVNNSMAEPVTFDARLVKRAEDLFAYAWRQNWVQTNHPTKDVPLEAAAPTGKSAKGGKNDKKPAAAAEEDTPDIVVPEPPVWDQDLKELKQLLLAIVDKKASDAEGFEWRTQQVYMGEYDAIVTALSAIAPPVAPMSRTSVAQALISRMVETVAERCAFSRSLLSLPEPNVFVVPAPEPEVYVPRIEINVAKKGAKKGKDDKKGKDKGKGKAADENVSAAPEPLEPDVAAKLAPIQFQTAREAVVDILDEWTMVMPSTARESEYDLF